ncbi:AMP-binding protein [Hyphomicrobium sp.]|uniref:AMP-binding protein n=1 Tax=Hyphomicrobium sp. TaxID=82 RepID=UPI0025C6F7F5|nr:AMP-binding protein [Hyphomicrobium sp.]MCC7250499.1 AMP-binding protein [Hyphomicrobium sp.]
MATHGATGQIATSANLDCVSAPLQEILSRQDDWTLPKTLRAQAAKRPSAPALQFENGATLSYAELLQRVEAFSANLLSMGVARGDRVALVMENSIEMVVAWCAINLIAAVEVPVNHALRGRFLTHVLENSAAEIVIIDGGLIGPLVDIKDDVTCVKHLVVNGAPKLPLPWPVSDFDTLIAGCDDAGLERVRAIDVAPDEPAAIIYTSGTTGPAKGVLLPHGQMWAWAYHMCDALRITHEDVYLVVLPLFHGNAQIMQVYAAMMAGAKVALYKRFSTSRWVDQAIESKATVSSLLGVMAQFIFDQKPCDKDAHVPISRMVTIPMPAAIGERFRRRFNVACIEAYGMTEICLPIMQRLNEEPRPGSCGRVIEDWFEVAIVDPETDRDLPPNTVGEIVVRPKHPCTMMLDYFRMPERTLKAWRNLWFHTGDSGKYDEDGYYYFVDRLQDRIRRRGENISSYEIEAVAAEFENVLEAAAIAVPAAEGDDDIELCVVTRDGTLDYLVFLEHCRKRMAHFAVPRYFRVFNEFPKTPNGKVLKRELRQSSALSTWDRVAAGIHIGRDS